MNHQVSVSLDQVESYQFSLVLLEQPVQCYRNHILLPVVLLYSDHHLILDRIVHLLCQHSHLILPYLQGRISVLLGNMLTLVIGLPVIATSITFEAKPIILILVLGVFQLGIPYIFYTTAIKHVTALDAIIFPIIEPILNPILVFFILGETLGPWAFLGGTLVLGGVIARGILRTDN